MWFKCFCSTDKVRKPLCFGPAVHRTADGYSMSDRSTMEQNCGSAVRYAVGGEYHMPSKLILPAEAGGRC